MRRAKIVATLGPSLSDLVNLKAAVAAGLDVARLNFSHGTHDQHADSVRMVGEAARAVNRHVGTLGDLQGPKIRLGELPASGIALDKGAEVILHGGRHTVSSYDDGMGTPVLPVVYPELADDLEPGSIVLIDDGSIRLVVSRTEPPMVHARVIGRGTARSRKGVNLPGVDVSAHTLTEKDRVDLRTMVDLEVDWIALSFVRRRADVEEVRSLVHSMGGEAPIIAKLERPEVIEDLDGIIEVSDAVMVARGDLGVEIGPEKVPALQKDIIARANRTGKPVITATEMLESMTTNTRPTRAEASDVANAVFDGTDALMLSGETARGKYPVEAIRTMARIIEVAEGSPQLVHPPEPPARGLSITRVVAKAAVQAAADVEARAIVVFSLSGASVQLVSKFRPTVPIIGLTTRDRSMRRVSLMWGSEARRVPDGDHSRDLIAAAEEVCLTDRFAERGDAVVIVSGIPGGGGGTNRLLVHRIGEAAD